MADDRPYQHEPQIAQLEAERANAVAYGDEARLASIDKRLAGFGVKVDAAKERKAAAKDEDKSRVPQGRSSRPIQKTDA